MFLSSCETRNQKAFNTLETKIVSLAQKASILKKKYEIFDMETIANFEWDKLYIFDEYTTLKTINEVVGSNWDGISVPSNHRRILFVNNKKVADFIDYRYDKLPLFFYSCSSNQQIVIERKFAKFTVFKSCGDMGNFYPMIPINCLSIIDVKRYLQKDCK